ncbi:YGGT family protein [Actinidia rufa]|uniref:YGGT family protein n=1 Tax=Actinidia rufa TaxID=165716 RepID=A0A7J0FQP4_9ERIC|nr:YGGT family protein [Actinidia rufa]
MASFGPRECHVITNGHPTRPPCHCHLSPSCNKKGRRAKCKMRHQSVTLQPHSPLPCTRTRGTGAGVDSWCYFFYSTLCDPYLNIFRGLIPSLGGTLDLLPILAFLVLNAFTSTVAALPTELSPTGISQELPTSCTTTYNLSTSQQKWMRRLYGSRRTSSSGDN